MTRLRVPRALPLGFPLSPGRNRIVASPLHLQGRNYAGRACRKEYAVASIQRDGDQGGDPSEAEYRPARSPNRVGATWIGTNAVVLEAEK